MADSKLTGLTANTTPALTDLVYMVDDPGGTPLSQKITIANLLATPSATFVTPILGVAAATSLALANGSVSAPALRGADADSGFYFSGNNIRFAVDGEAHALFDGGGMTHRASAYLAWGSTFATDTRDLILTRIAAGILGLAGNATGATMQFTEMTAPAAGAANTARIYAVDNGSGKTQLMAIFASGAAQQLAIEP